MADVEYPGLVISRKRGESVQIGNSVTVQVVEIQGGKVKLRIKAPLETLILRTELIGREPREGDE